MATPRTELVAGLADRSLRRGHALTARQRRRAVEALADVSPMIRSWHRWDQLFRPLYCVGASCHGVGVLTLALEASPLVVAGAVLAGTVTTAFVAVRLWCAVGQALSITAGLVCHDF